MQTDGSIPESAANSPCSNFQLYPEALPQNPPETADPVWGRWSLSDLAEQRNPRLFSTHLAPKYLPKQLLSRGRIIYVMRNPKDAYLSLHYFKGEPRDGFMGNEHGPGSFARYLAPPAESQDPYGSYFQHVRDMQELFGRAEMTGRYAVVYYEELKTETREQIRRLATFLGAEISERKLGEIEKQVSFHNMKSGMDSNRANLVMRKGEVGDWKNLASPSRSPSARGWLRDPGPGRPAAQALLLPTPFP
uniref:Sulfotransferase n=1 Tax=Tetraselmis sp. GSL018 TaxID=582737 RepID=A0A061RVB2_9CHLO